MTFPVPALSDRQPGGRTRWRQRLLWLCALVTLLTLVTLAYLGGPRNELGPNSPTPRALPPTQIDQLDTWLQHNEAAFPDIRAGNAKSIVWANASHQRTLWSIVYLHGFSSSRFEMSPLPEHLAQALGANLYFPRLSGHGRSSAAMAEASAQDWMADTIEAVHIGQTLGSHVLLISCSTGGTLATWFGLSNEAHRVDAHIFISPNFGTKDKRGELINGPWGRQLALLVSGANHGQKAHSAAEANAWTTPYPTRALFPMLALVKSVRDSDLSTFQTPLLVLYSPRDQVVDPQETLAAYARIGSPLKSIATVDYSTSLLQHVLAGQLRDPAAVEPMTRTMLQWVHGLPLTLQD